MNLPPTPDERPPILTGSTRQRLEEARAVARRLPLSTPGERHLRGLLIEVITIVVGDDHQMHEDLANSGAIYAPPEVQIPSPSRVQYHVQQPNAFPPRAAAPTAPSPAPPAFNPRPQPGIARHVPPQTRALPVEHGQAPQTRPLTIEEAARAMNPSPVASSPAMAPIPIRPPALDSQGNPDPQGEAFLEGLQAQIDDQDTGG